MAPDHRRAAGAAVIDMSASLSIGGPVLELLGFVLWTMAFIAWFAATGNGWPFLLLLLQAWAFFLPRISTVETLEPV